MKRTSIFDDRACQCGKNGVETPRYGMEPVTQFQWFCDDEGLTCPTCGEMRVFADYSHIDGICGNEVPLDGGMKSVVSVDAISRRRANSLAMLRARGELRLHAEMIERGDAHPDSMAYWPESNTYTKGGRRYNSDYLDITTAMDLYAAVDPKQLLPD